MSISEKLLLPTLSKPLVLGRERFEKFSAVEGIYLTAQEKRMFAEMDRKKMPNDERRKIILAGYKAEA